MIKKFLSILFWWRKDNTDKVTKKSPNKMMMME